MTLPDDFETVPSGTHKMLTETQMRLEKCKENLRLIMDTYPSSTMAHQAAQDTLDILADDRSDELEQIKNTLLNTRLAKKQAE